MPPLEDPSTGVPCPLWQDPCKDIPPLEDPLWEDPFKDMPPLEDPSTGVPCPLWQDPCKDIPPLEDPLWEDPFKDMPPLEDPTFKNVSSLEDEFVRPELERMNVFIPASETNDISEPAVLEDLLYQKSNDDVEVPPRPFIVSRSTDFHANEKDFDLAPLPLDSPQYMDPLMKSVILAADCLPCPPLNPPPGYFRDGDFVTGPEEYTLQWSNGRDDGIFMRMHQDSLEIRLVESNSC